MDLAQVSSVLLVIFGFGFVIFWHELGHFLAAKWANVRVEQFAVGFGQAILTWRKGLGVTYGSTARRTEQIVQRERELARANTRNEPVAASVAPGGAQLSADSSNPRGDEPKAHPYPSDEEILKRLGIGETEYRLNWIPLGGYVKMLGQDDLRPNAQQNDPRAYNMKPIGQRMVIVSAGVIMNIILAAILFFVLFLIGFDVPPAMVGQLQPNSPAQQAGLEVGDRILTFDGKKQHDFTKISLNVALVDPGAEVPIEIQKPDGSKRSLKITPRRNEMAGGFLSLGIVQPAELAGFDAKLARHLAIDDQLVPPQYLVIKPGDVITAINGRPVDYKTDLHLFDQALQQSYGKPILLTVKNVEGQLRQVEVQPTFISPFGSQPLHFVGMVPRPKIETLTENSVAKGKLLPGDVVVRLINRQTNDSIGNLTSQRLMSSLNEAGRNDVPIDLIVLRGGKEKAVDDLTPNARLGEGRRGLGVQLSYEEDRAVVGEALADSPAARAGIPAGAVITAIAGQPVQSWYDVHRLLAQAPSDAPIVVTAAHHRADGRDYQLKLTEADQQQLLSNRYSASLALRERIEQRSTANPFIAAAWGVGETRDLIIQFYLTLKRMVTGDISYKSMMGPVGIFSAGTKFAYRGTDWLIWFLAMISANLAVVNFLPIPIVDGGLFVFLIVEKIQGKPISPRMQSVAQVVGLALILSIFLLVTYQDILRIGNF